MGQTVRRTGEVITSYYGVVFLKRRYTKNEDNARYRNVLGNRDEQLHKQKWKKKLAAVSVGT